jgi:hypothetical protein
MSLKTLKQKTFEAWTFNAQTLGGPGAAAVPAARACLRMTVAAGTNLACSVERGTNLTVTIDRDCCQ